MTEQTQPRDERSDLPENLPQPAHRALSQAGLTCLDQVATRSERNLLQLHGVGPKAIRLLKQALEARGLSFAEPADRR